MKLSEEQYLAIDRAADIRSEFLDGEMLPRGGVNIRHAVLQTNLCGELYAALLGDNCEAFTADLRVRVLPGRMYAYPDASAVCGKPMIADEHGDILLNPVVLIEVLSPSTEFYDRCIKFRYYRMIDSLRDYVLVDQDKMRIEQYTRGEAGTWTLRDYQNPEDELKIESIGVSLQLSRIYDRVELPPA